MPRGETALHSKIGGRALGNGSARPAFCDSFALLGKICTFAVRGLLTLDVATVKGGTNEFAGTWVPCLGDLKMAKPTTIKIRLNSTAGTGHFYVTKKNARTMTEKMTVNKYDPVVRKHVEYKEGKIK